MEGPASDAIVVDGEDVVVSELDQDGVAGFEFRRHDVHQALGDEGAGTAPAFSGIDGVHPFGVEVAQKGNAPALIGEYAVGFGGAGIAYQVEGRQGIVVPGGYGEKGRWGREQGFGQFAVREAADALDNRFGMETGAGPGGVLEIGEIVGRFLLPEGIPAVCRQGVEVEETGAAGAGGVGGPGSITIEAAFDSAFHPGSARRRRAKDDDGPFVAGLANILPQVPAVGVDGLVALAQRLFAVARQGSAIRMGGRVASVVMAEGDQDEVAGMEPVEDLLPRALLAKAAAAAAAEGFIEHLHSGRIEECRQFRTHAPGAGLAAAGAGTSNGIAHQVKRWGRAGK